MKNPLPRELLKLCDAIGEFIEYWGFKSVEGRIWAHLLLSERTLCAQDLMERLEISKGLASISLKRLLEYRVIKIDCVRFRKTQFFAVNENVTEVIKGVLRQRERLLMADIEKKCELLLEMAKQSNLPDINTKRVKFLLSMIKKARIFLNALLFKDPGLGGIFFGKVPKIK